MTSGREGAARGGRDCKGVDTKTISVIMMHSTWEAIVKEIVKQVDKVVVVLQNIRQTPYQGVSDASEERHCECDAEKAACAGDSAQVRHLKELCNHEQ
ncbi:hypothetical protein FN846DRAFT_902823 [Sphaerosporella brunnea]|uniref:Uncharacterized protein n=1 Tax=Sphaerosporella brunnea TaxID=1250544 RepID=A0A5J5F9D6_9PEZI|nr:hypothetical protein FN846DRAFT_902823 [Sphaerosporella brunnea]